MATSPVLVSAAAQILTGLATNTLMEKPDAVVEVLLKGADSTTPLEIKQAIEDFFTNSKRHKSTQKAVRQAEQWFVSDISRAHAIIKHDIQYFGNTGYQQLPAFVKKLEEGHGLSISVDWEALLNDLLKERFSLHQELSDRDYSIAAKQYILYLRNAIALIAQDDPLAQQLLGDAILENQRTARESLRILEGLSDGFFDLYTNSRDTQHGGYRSFVTLYMGSQDGARQHAPFGGRDHELDKLSEWLFQDEQGYSLLTGGAGMGKSALILHWLERLRTDERFAGWRLAYWPISARFGTNTETTILDALEYQIIEAFDEVWMADQAERNRQSIHMLLKETWQTHQPPLLIVLDGLDEAVGEIESQKLTRSLFDFAPPPSVKILVTARDSAIDWQARLGWPEAWVQPFHLAGLSEEGIADVLNNMGNPLAGLGYQEQIIPQLHRVSDQGDPFLLGLYMQALRDNANATGRFTVQNLPEISAGLDAFMQAWEADQQQRWQASHSSTAIDQQTLLDFRDLLSVAEGGLTFFDLVHLSGNFHNRQDLVEQAPAYYRCFIAGNGQSSASGFVYLHDRLRSYFRNQNPEKLPALHRRFADYGRKLIEQLEQGTVSPKQSSYDFTYILQNYLYHLDMAKAPPEYYYALICQGWVNAWLAKDKIDLGFLDQVDVAWAVAKEEGAKALHIQVLAGLCHSSVNTLNTDISGKILNTLWKSNCLNTVQVENLLSRINTWEKSMHALVKCLPTFRKRDQHKYHHYIDLILASARQTEDERRKADILRAMAKVVPPTIQAEILLETRSFKSKQEQAKVLSALAQAVPPAMQGEILKEALRIDIERCRAEVLRSLAKVVSPTIQADIISAARQINDLNCRAQVLCTVAEVASPEFQEEINLEALQAAQQIEDEWNKADILSCLVKVATPIMQAAILTEARNCDNERNRAQILSRLAAVIPPAMQAEILAEARLINDRYLQVAVLCALAGVVEPTLREELCQEALAVTRQIKDSGMYGLALEKLALVVPTTMQMAILAASHKINFEMSQAEVLAILATVATPAIQFQILAEAQQFGNYEDRGKILIALAKVVSPEMQGEILATARLINRGGKQESFFGALAGMAPPTSKEQYKKEVLTTVQMADNVFFRASVLGVMARIVPAAIQAEILQEAHQTNNEYNRTSIVDTMASIVPPSLQKAVLQAARQINYESGRSSVLQTMARAFPPTQHAEILAEARQIGDKICRAIVLSALAEVVSPELNEQVCHEALQAVQQVEDKYDIVHILVKLVRLVPLTMQPVILAEAQQINDDKTRVEVLSALAKVAPPALQADILAEARQIGEEAYRAIVLSALASVCSPTMLYEIGTEALDIAQQINYEGCEPEVLEAAIKQGSRWVEEEISRIALAAVYEFNYGSHITNAVWLLAEVGPSWMKEKFRKIALATTFQIEGESDQLYMFSELAWQASGKSLQEMFLLTKLIEDRDFGCRVFQEVLNSKYFTPELIGFNAEQLLEFALEFFKDAKRQVYTDMLVALIPEFGQVAGDRIYPEIKSAILKVKDWWP